MSDVCLTPPAQGTREKYWIPAWNPALLQARRPVEQCCKADWWFSQCHWAQLCTAQTRGGQPGAKLSSGCKGLMLFLLSEKGVQTSHLCPIPVEAGSRNVRATGQKVNRSNGSGLSPVVGRKQAPRAPTVTLKTLYSYFFKKIPNWCCSTIKCLCISQNRLYISFCPPKCAN